MVTLKKLIIYIHIIYEAYIKIKGDINMSVPNDPMMLLSFVNLKLRDFYPSLDAMCEDMELNKDEIIAKLATIDYEYDEALNKFC